MVMSWSDYGQIMVIWCWFTDDLCCDCMMIYGQIMMNCGDLWWLWWFWWVIRMDDWYYDQSVVYYHEWRRIMVIYAWFRNRLSLARLLMSRWLIQWLNHIVILWYSEWCHGWCHKMLFMMFFFCILVAWCCQHRRDVRPQDKFTK